MTLVISAVHLRAILSKRNLLLVDTRPFSSYLEAHIPGAINIDLMHFHWIDSSKKGISQFNHQAKILLSNIGVSSKRFVVFYDDISGSSAARGVWLLLYFSHREVKMLDGGMNKWKAMGYRTETNTNPTVHSNFKGRPNPRILVDYQRIAHAAGKAKTIIIEARSKEEFDGTAIRAARAGHIPNAVNIDWNYNLEQDGFKPKEMLQRLYAKIAKDAEIITYCQGGYRAANSFVALKMLGYKKVRMYRIVERMG